MGTDLKQTKLSGSIIKNTFVDNYGLNKLTLFSYDTYNFNQFESEFTLLELQTINHFENKFKDLSWNFSLKQQRKDSMNFISTNGSIGTAIGKAYNNVLYASLGFDTLIDSSFIDIFPKINAHLYYSETQFNLSISKKYRVQYLKTEIIQILSDNINFKVVHEDFNKIESRTFASIEVKI